MVKQFFKPKYLNNKLDKVILTNKIIIIESADPGYDWIFNYNIKGLITKYGGANSHMAIRSAEKSIPRSYRYWRKII